MSEARALIAETASRIFEDAVDAELLASCEAGTWPRALWDAVEETGLTRALVSSGRGGADGDWLDVYEIARAAGRHCVPLPIVETILAAWLLDRAGMQVPDGPLGLVPAEIAAQEPARFERVPWGRHAGHIVGVATGAAGGVFCAARDGFSIDEGHNLALEPRDTITLASPPAAGGAAPAPGSIERLGALLRCGQMTGALESLLDRSIQYAGERVQFGKPIGSFQIIQQELARMAGLVAEAATATEVAFAAADRAAGVGGEVADSPTFEIACARVVAGDAAEVAPRIAHQTHGAIGFTYEHSLHFSSRRLWAWRTEFGATETWAARLGEAVGEREGAVWALVTDR